MDYSLTELQLTIMDVLWGTGEATVTEVHEELRKERRVAESTVATILSRLRDKGVVEHRMEDRRYVYRAAVSAEQVRHSMVSEFSQVTERLFSGDVASIVSQLLNVHDVKPEDLDQARAIIEQKARQLRQREEEEEE